MEKELFNKEQLEELQKISQLKGEEQQKKFNEFLKKCTPEQVEHLKQQYGGSECPFCLIRDGKLESDVLYKDDFVMVVFDINPGNKGHMLVFPLNHDTSVINSKDCEKIMSVAQRVAKTALEVLKVEGINILIGDGALAGQRVAHGYVHVIPRYENDKVNIKWDKVEINKKEYEEISKSIKEKLKIKKIEVKQVKIVKREKKYKFKERIP